MSGTFTEYVSEGQQNIGLMLKEKKRMLARSIPSLFSIPSWVLDVLEVMHLSFCSEDVILTCLKMYLSVMRSGFVVSNV